MTPPPHPTPDAPGRQWLEVVSRPSLQTFASAFVAEPRLEAVVIDDPLVGVSEIRRFFVATEAMYEEIDFVAEARSVDRTWLEWSGRFCGIEVSGVTVLYHAPGGALARIRLHHYPRGALLAFSVELHRRLHPALPAPSPLSQIPLLKGHPMTTSIRRLSAVAASVLFATTSLASLANAAPAKNVVLVHGAFVDGSGWRAVADILTKDGYNVTIAQPPETSLDDDVAATKRLLDAQDGPTVLVGHSYGGAIISGAGDHAKVKSLVYVAAFQPDAGESLGSLASSKPPAGTPLKPSADGFLYIDQATFHDDFAADLPRAETSFMSRAQVGLSVRAAGAPAGAPAWKAKPSFAVVATRDRSINPDLERTMYKRAHSEVVEIASSHAVYMSHPAEIAALIEKAAR